MVLPEIPQQEKEYLRNFHNLFPSPVEGEHYLEDSWERMQVVLAWLRRLQSDGAGKVLELGSNPYFLTLLLKKHYPFHLSLANYFDESQSGEQTHVVEGGGERHEFRFAHFNLEVDRFPYENSKFDCVLFCEILEHLLLNADFPVSEIKRILRPGGYVILTTPNAARLANVVNILRGKNIYADYSPHGIYGRHNREYTLPEIIQLLERHSFEIIETQVRNIYPHSWKARMIQALRPKTWYEHIFVLARIKVPTASRPLTAEGAILGTLP